MINCQGVSLLTKTPKGKLYLSTKRIYDRHTGFHLESNKDGFLFANGRVSQFRKEDIPEYFVFGRYWKQHGWLSAKGVKYLEYTHPTVEFLNHAMRDDSLFVSFDKPIWYNSQYSMYEDYFAVVSGWDIVSYLKAVEKYSPSVDTEEIRHRIQGRLYQYRACWPDEHETPSLTDEFIENLFT